MKNLKTFILLMRKYGVFCVAGTLSFLCGVYVLALPVMFAIGKGFTSYSCSGSACTQDFISGLVLFFIGLGLMYFCKNGWKEINRDDLHLIHQNMS